MLSTHKHLYHKRNWYVALYVLYVYMHTETEKWRQKRLNRDCDDQNYGIAFNLVLFFSIHLLFISQLITLSWCNFYGKKMHRTFHVYSCTEQKNGLHLVMMMVERRNKSKSIDFIMRIRAKENYYKSYAYFMTRFVMAFVESYSGKVVRLCSLKKSMNESILQILSNLAEKNREFWLIIKLNCSKAIYESANSSVSLCALFCPFIGIFQKCVFYPVVIHEFIQKSQWRSECVSMSSLSKTHMIYIYTSCVWIICRRQQMSATLLSISIYFSYSRCKRLALRFPNVVSLFRPFHVSGS